MNTMMAAKEASGGPALLLVVQSAVTATVTAALAAVESAAAASAADSAAEAVKLSIEEQEVVKTLKISFKKT